MKIIHVPYTYHPDAVGGTEIYVEGLARSLQAAGIESVICAPGADDRPYVHSGMVVRRFARERPGFSVHNGYAGDEAAAAEFARILDLEKPSVVHAHALGAEVWLPLAREVKARGIPLVFTYHNCTGTCESGTLLRWRSEPCDGRLDAARCAGCALNGLGMPALVAAMVGRIPAAVGGFVAARGLQGRAWTALRMNELIARKHSALRSFFAACDAIVAPAPWVRELLVANGAPANRIVLCAQGVDEHAASAVHAAASPPMRVAMLTRLDWRKGIEELVDAFARAPALEATLDLFILRQPGDDEGYARRVARKAAADGRIRLVPGIAHERVVDTLRGYHLLAVPSLVPETGPLVVLEAFAAGIPVIGSAVGGIADRIAHGRDGWLVRPGDREAWAEALRSLASDPAALARLAAGVRPPLAMARVAATMQALYGKIASAPHPSAVRTIPSDPVSGEVCGTPTAAVV